MRKIYGTLLVFALLSAMAVGTFADFWKSSDSWFYNSDVAGTLTFSDNKATYTVDVVAGDNFLDLQRNFTGSLTEVSFVPAVKMVTLYFVGFQYESDYLAGAFGYSTFGPFTPYTVEMPFDAPIDWEAAAAFFATNQMVDWGWDDDGWFEVWGNWADDFAAVMYWDAGMYNASVLTGDDTPLCDFAVDPETGIIYIVGVIADPPVAEPVFASAEVTSVNTNLQDKNNDNLTFTVTVTLSDGSTYDVDHVESVNGQQKGSTTFDYDEYSVYVAWNDNNKVTFCYVLAE